VPSHLHQSGTNQSQIYDPYNIALANDDEAGSPIKQNPSQRQTPYKNINNYQLELGANNGGTKSGISALNLGTGLFSADQEEPTTAAIIKQDTELNQLKMCSPSQNNFQTINSDQEDADALREQSNKQIDEMYEMRNS